MLRRAESAPPVCLGGGSPDAVAGEDGGSVQRVLLHLGVEEVEVGGQPGAAIRRESTLWMTEVLLAVVVNNALPAVCRAASTRNTHALHRGEIHLTV